MKLVKKLAKLKDKFRKSSATVSTQATEDLIFAELTDSDNLKERQHQTDKVKELQAVILKLQQDQD